MILKNKLFLCQIALLFCLLIVGACHSETNESEQPPTAVLVHKQYEERIEQLATAVKNLAEACKSNEAPNKLQALFKEAKYAYKRTEYLTELYFPYTAKSLNGPPLDEVEFDDINQTIIEPEGFQVIEEMMFPWLKEADRDELQKKVEQLASNVYRLKAVAATTTFTDSHIFDALRLEIFRLVTLGISGFDSPSALNSIPEAKAVFTELSTIYKLYSQEDIGSDYADRLFTEAIDYLQKNNDFEAFDRLNFITKYANPLSELLLARQEALKIPVFSELRPLSSSANSLFDTAAFNVNAFSPAYNRSPSDKQIALGEMLFFDPVLSGDNSRACASCHLPEKGFTDGISKSFAFGSSKELERNAPTILNAGLQASLFYDGRVAFLEDQVADVVLNPDEMHGNFETAADKMANSNEYSILFTQAFGSTGALTEKTIKMALASYVRSKVSMNSSFDQYMRGDTSSLTALQIEGFNLFMGKAACGTCHFMPLFNGTVPPSYKVSETEILGVPATNDTSNFVLDSDVGKFNLFQKDLHKFAFKTPTVRNIALTAPYMHNGVYQTLEEVMDFYNQGGGAGRGIEVPHQTLSADALELTVDEVEAIIAFMHSLTDTTNLVSRPSKLPVINNAVELSQSRTLKEIY